jgi:long-chain acyl-CoA synthetase
VGLKDAKYGEIVAAFLQAEPIGAQVPDKVIQQWVLSKLARHKAPQHIFWVGSSEVGHSLPLTGSGKVKKNVLRDLGNTILTSREHSIHPKQIPAKL